MRICFTIPDTIGDFVMRQPLFEAVHRSGHQCLLVLRPSLAPVARLVAPGADVVTFEGNPYAADFLEGLEARLGPVAERVRRNSPDLLAVTPYQWTALDEFLARSLAPAPSVAMFGPRFAHDSADRRALPAELPFSHTVEVRELDSEFRKNEALCSYLLGEPVHLPPPRLSLTQEVEARAMSVLRGYSLRAGEYWVVCAGHNRWTKVKNWNLPGWTEACRFLLRQSGKHLLFIGTPDEQPAVGEVLDGLEGDRDRCVDLSGKPPELDVLTGLIAQSAGYLGKDTGPMHIAAATGRPLVALFGGGHWPRFIPQAERGAVLSRPLPCSNCNWICHLRESLCIKDVTVDEVIRELEHVLSGEPGFRLIAPEPGVEVLTKLAAESAHSIRERVHAAQLEQRSAEERTRQAESALQATRREYEEALEAAGHRMRAVNEEHEATKERWRLAELAWEEKTQDFGRQVREMQAAHAKALGEAQDRAMALQEEAGRLRELAGRWHARNLDLEYRAVAAEKQAADAAGEAARFRTAMQVVLGDHRQMELTIEELERKRKELEGDITESQRRLVDLEVEKEALKAELQTVRNEHATLRRLMASVGRSPFTRLLRASGIWKVRFPEE